MSRSLVGAAALTTPGPGDLDGRGDVHDLVVHFYREIVFDDLLGPVFGEIAEVDWTVHIPRLIDYWCRVLLGEAGYRGGAILAVHRHAHDLAALRAEHFDRWCSFPVSTPVNWNDGDDVIISPALTDDDAAARFPEGFTTLTPYLRLTPHPNR